MQLKFLMALYHYIMVIGPTRNITNDDIVNGDTLLDIIDEGIKNKSKQDETTEVLLNDFHFLLNSLGKEDITYETEDEIVTRKALEEREKALAEKDNALEEKKKTDRENRQLKQKIKDKDFQQENIHSELSKEKHELSLENENLRRQNEELRSKISSLEKENHGLKERFMKVRTFMTERCAKIPFFGKRLLREMQSELGENQLQEAKENENIDR